MDGARLDERGDQSRLRHRLAAGDAIDDAAPASVTRKSFSGEPPTIARPNRWTL